MMTWDDDRDPIQPVPRWFVVLMAVVWVGAILFLWRVLR